MAATHDSELEAFKTAIDLRAYAMELGYVLDRRESWRGSSVMRNEGTGDKLIVKRDRDQHYVYFSVRDDRDNGSIIDFAMRRKGLNLGQVRKELRRWLGKPAASLSLFPTLPVTAKDRFAVDASLRRMAEAQRHPYQEKERGIAFELLASDRFAGRVWIDERGNAVFPHFDLEGLCGYEIKNRNFTGFSRGGQKGLWLSHREAGDDCLVVAESAIDALSYAGLFPAPATRYASIGGEMNPRQPELMRAAAARLPLDAKVVAAMDNDAGGKRLIELVEAAVGLSGRQDLKVSAHCPSTAKDWNEVLMASQPSFPTVHLGGCF